MTTPKRETSLKRNRGGSRNMNRQRKRIIWIKTKPPIKIKEMAPVYDEIEIVNAPVEFFDSLLSQFNQYEVKVFSDKDDESPLNKETYYQNHEAISSNHTVHYIIIHNDEKLIEAILV